MNSKTLTALKALLWLIFLFHVSIGLGLNVAPAFPQAVADYYGADVNWTPELLYIVKPVGAFMIAFGSLAVVAARDPVRYAPIVYAFVLLFTIRGLQRLVFQSEISSALAIDSGRNIGNAAFFLLMAVVLVLLTRAACKEATTV